MKVIPSLVDSVSLTVKGNVEFSHPLKVQGVATITSADEKTKALPNEIDVLSERELYL
jgi:hypothetical protein